MTRINILLINFLILYASLVAPEVTVNTPDNPVIIGKVLMVTWTTTSPLSGTGDLRLMLDQSTNIQIDGSVDLAKLSYRWIVNAPPGTYFWGLFFGGSAVFSNSFPIMNEPLTSSTANPTSTTSTNTTPVSTVFATQTQTVTNDSSKGPSVGTGIIIGIAIVVGIIVLVGSIICGFSYFKKKKFIPTAGTSIL